MQRGGEGPGAGRQRDQLLHGETGEAGRGGAGSTGETGLGRVSCTVLYCTVLYCTVLYCTVLHCTVLYCTVLYCTVLYCTVLYCTVLYCTVLYCTVWDQETKMTRNNSKANIYRHYQKMPKEIIDIKDNSKFSKYVKINLIIPKLPPKGEVKSDLPKKNSKSKIGPNICLL